MFISSLNTNKDRQQIESWLPFLLTKLNYARTRRMIPALTALSASEKIARAIILFEQLLSIETNAEMKLARQWSLEYFQACAAGHKARREFLVAEGIYRRGELLACPERVQPQMEICNLNPTNYQNPLGEETRALTELMFNEFLAVKSLLSFPNWHDIATLITTQIPTLTSKRLPEPRLKISLLIKDYVEQTIAEARRVGGTPLVAIFGPGKGEELVPLTRNGFSVLCLDAHSYDTIKNLFEHTFELAASPAPEMVTVCESAKVDMSAFNVWKNKEYPPTIFICSNIDFSNAGVIPQELYDIGRVAASNNVLHEMRSKEVLFTNMTRVSRGSVVIFDGYPSSAAFDNIVLPVSDHVNVPITGHDAVVSYLLAPSPQEMGKIARAAAPHLTWEAKVVGPPLSAPLFHKLQGAVIGRS